MITSAIDTPGSTNARLQRLAQISGEAPDVHFFLTHTTDGAGLYAGQVGQGAVMYMFSHRGFAVVVARIDAFLDHLLVDWSQHDPSV